MTSNQSSVISVVSGPMKQSALFHGLTLILILTAAPLLSHADTEVLWERVDAEAARGGDSEVILDQLRVFLALSHTLDQWILKYPLDEGQAADFGAFLSVDRYRKLDKLRVALGRSRLVNSILDDDGEQQRPEFEKYVFSRGHPEYLFGSIPSQQLSSQELLDHIWRTTTTREVRCLFDLRRATDKRLAETQGPEAAVAREIDSMRRPLIRNRRILWNDRFFDAVDQVRDKKQSLVTLESYVAQIVQLGISKDDSTDLGEIDDMYARYLASHSQLVEMLGNAQTLMNDYRNDPQYHPQTRREEIERLQAATGFVRGLVQASPPLRSALDVFAQRKFQAQRRADRLPETWRLDGEFLEVARSFLDRLQVRLAAGRF